MPRSAASPEANTGGMLESIEASPKATRSSVARRRASSGDSPLDDARTTPGITKYAAVSVTNSAAQPAMIIFGRSRHAQASEISAVTTATATTAIEPGTRTLSAAWSAIPCSPATTSAGQAGDSQARDGENERAIRQRGEPWQNAEVITDVVMQRRFGHAEPHRRAGEHGVTPPVAGAERQQDAQDDAEHDGGGEQRVLRHRFDDLEIVEAVGHLHGADRAIDDQQVAGDPGDGDGRREGLQHAGEVACRDECRAARERLIPRPLGGLDCQPPTPNQSGDEERGADDVQPAPARSRGHAAAPTPCAVSQRSTSARYPSRACTLVASNRITSTGWVFEARSKPQPSGNVMRTPSSVETGYFFANAVAASSTTANFCSSGQSTRISGVANVFGRSASKRDSGPPSRAT